MEREAQLPVHTVALESKAQCAMIRRLIRSSLNEMGLNIASQPLTLRSAPSAVRPNENDVGRQAHAQRPIMRGSTSLPRP
jgi:hypothetical protein